MPRYGQALFLMLSLLSNGYCQVTSQPGTDVRSRVQQSWAAKEAVAKRVHIVLEEELIYPTGSISNSLPKSRLQRMGIAGPVPPVDTRAQRSLNLTMDGVRLRLAVRGTEWSFRERRLAEEHYVVSYDGKEARRLRDPGGDARVATGSVHPALDIHDFSEARLVPLLYVLRASDMRLAPPLQQFAIISAAERLGGAICYHLRLTRSQDGSIYTDLWVDPAKECVPVKITEVMNYVPKIQINVTSEFRDQLGWLPSSWTYSSTDDSNKSLAQTGKVRLTKTEFPEAVADSQFQLTFPAGSYVIDARTRKSQWATGDPEQFELESSFWRRYRLTIIGCCLLGLSLVLYRTRVIWCRSRPASQKGVSS